MSTMRSYSYPPSDPYPNFGSDTPTNRVRMVAFSLDFERRQRVAGERIEGHVNLDVLGLRRDKVEDVRLELKGALYIVAAKTTSAASSTFIDSATPTRSVNTKVEPTVSLISEGMSVWSQGTAHSDALRVPFSFTLPADLPPSCEVICSHWAGSVIYALVVSAKRVGLLRHQTLEEHIGVVRGSRKGAVLHAALAAGPWKGEWKTLRAEKDIRRGLWGEYSHVTASLILPAVTTFPTDTDIPFTLRIVTTSRVLGAEEAQAEHVFPEPPSRFPDLDFRLERTARCAKEKAVISGDLITRFDCFKLDKFPERTRVDEKRMWRPLSEDGGENNGKGRWRQEATLKSTFRLECPPSFQLPEIQLEYGAHLKISFTGIGNNLVIAFPMRVVSPKPPPPSNPFVDEASSMYSQE